MHVFVFDAEGNVVGLALGTAQELPMASAVRPFGEGHWQRRFGIEPEILAVVCRSADRCEARFFNPDGTSEKVCGNALRCIPQALLAAGDPWSASARIAVETGFGTVHVCRPSAGLGAADFSETDISVSLGTDGDVLVDVGTPHHVRFVSDLLAPEVTRLGREWSQGADPVNATFVEPHKCGLRVRTLERGVDHETQSCGTGALAAYLACRETRTGSASNGRGCEVCFVSKRRLWVGPGGPPMTVRVSGACRLLRSGTPKPRPTSLGAPESARGVGAWFAPGGG